MTELLVALCAVFLVVMIGKAWFAWPGYRDTIYQQLFGSFLEYFWKYSVSRDLSSSGYLASRIGRHRLLYNSYRDHAGHEAAQFVTILSERGFACVCCIHTSGTVTGGENGAWRIERGGVTRPLGSPLTYVRKQQRFLSKALDKLPVSYAICFDAGSDLSGISCPYPTLCASDVVGYLEGLKGSVSEAQVEEAFEGFKRTAGIA